MNFVLFLRVWGALISFAFPWSCATVTHNDPRAGGWGVVWGVGGKVRVSDQRWRLLG